MSRRDLVKVGFGVAGIAALSGVGSIAASALEVGNTVDFTVGHRIDYTGKAFTTLMHCDDAISYCAWPRKKTPAEGIYPVEIARPRNTSGAPDADVGYTFDVANLCLRATMWFGYGGPGFDPAVFPPTWWDGSGWDDDKYYVVTHLNESCYYLWDGGVQAQWGVSQAFKTWAERWIYGPSSGHAPDCMEQKMQARFDEVPDWFQVYAINQDKSDTQPVIFAAGEPVGVAGVTKSASQKGWL